MLSTNSLDKFIEYKSILEDASKFELHASIIENIRKTSSVADNPPFSMIVEAELVPLLLNYHLKVTLSQQILENIIWIITNIASGESTQTMYIMSQGGIEYFVGFCNTDNFSEEVYAQALWGLGNIAGESAYNRDKMLEMGILHLTLKIYYSEQTKKLATKKTIAWVINNLCRHKPTVKFSEVKDAMPYLYNSLENQKDEDPITDNLWTCNYMTKGFIDEDMLSFAKSGILEKIAHWIKIASKSNQISILIPGLMTLSNIATGNAEATDYILDLDITTTIVDLLSHISNKIRKEVCFLLSNIAAGTTNQVNQLFSIPELLPKLKYVIMFDDIKIKIEAFWIFSNLILQGSAEHKIILANSDIFQETLKSNLIPWGNKGVQPVMKSLKEFLKFVCKNKCDNSKFIEIVDLANLWIKKTVYPSAEFNSNPYIEQIENYIDQFKSQVSEELSKNIGKIKLNSNELEYETED